MEIGDGRITPVQKQQCEAYLDVERNKAIQKKIMLLEHSGEGLVLYLVSVQKSRATVVLQIWHCTMMIPSL